MPRKAIDNSTEVFLSNVIAWGFTCLLLGVILVLPMPLGNIPPALAISLMALGILERDGLWVLAGLAVALASVLVVWGVVLASEGRHLHGWRGAELAAGPPAPSLEEWEARSRAQHIHMKPKFGVD